MRRTAARLVTQKQIESLMVVLDRRERELRARIADERARTDADDYSQLEGIVADEADRAFVETSVDIETGMVEHQLRELAEIDAARQRMAQGSFGVCVDCEGPIEYARLRIHPPAVRCAECQMLHENPGARSEKLSRRH
jgi:RNA polymerase-binding transcription factor